MSNPIRVKQTLTLHKQHSKKGVFIEYRQRLDFMMITPINAKPLSKPFNV